MCGDSHPGLLCLTALLPRLYFADVLPLFPSGRRNPLEFTWSLGVEEQFYILWPLLLAALVRRTAGDHRRLAQIVAALVLLAIGIRVIAWHMASVFYTPFEWTDSILLGCLLAVVFHGRLTDRWRLNSLALAAATIPLLWLSLRGFSRFDEVWTVTALAVGNATIVLAATRNQFGERDVLGSRVLTFFGRISYGLYLWHALINEVLSGRDMSPVVRALLISVGGSA